MKHKEQAIIETGTGRPTWYRKRLGKKLELLNSHLNKIGIKATTIGAAQLQSVVNDPWLTAMGGEGMIRLENGNVAYIVVDFRSALIPWIFTAYFCDYLVKVGGPGMSGAPQGTELIEDSASTKSGSGKVLTWQGEPSVANALNGDDFLRKSLASVGARVGISGGISIHPRLEWGYFKIRTKYNLPTPEFFQVLERIAGDLKSLRGA